MHERHVMNDLVRELELIALQENAARVTRIDVELGALSHFTPEHFLEHFRDASVGTCAADAEVRAVEAEDVTDERAQGVMLLGVEIEVR
jgi:hydrogenase nickel incorporation protein HypA/HybF